MAAASPLAVRAQPATPGIALLRATSSEPNVEMLRARRQGLREAGYVDGENVAIEDRWAENQRDRLPALAADLARRKVRVILAMEGDDVVLAAKAATATIPIFFLTSSDPVSRGLVISLAL